MYKNRNKDGSFNLCGPKIKALRQALKKRTSQNRLAADLQILGLDLDKNAIQKIECGKRFVTDIELAAFARYFQVPMEELIK